MFLIIYYFTKLEKIGHQPAEAPTLKAKTTSALK